MGLRKFAGLFQGTSSLLPVSAQEKGGSESCCGLIMLPMILAVFAPFRISTWTLSKGIGRNIGPTGRENHIFNLITGVYMLQKRFLRIT